MPNNNSTLLWSKLLPEPGGDDIGNALRCEIRDGLWLLARQWQLGEFVAEDAGTAAWAHLVAHSTPLQKVAGNAGTPVPVGAEAPLNAAVERIVPEFDLSLRLEAGRHWQRMLVQAGKAAAWELFKKNPLLHFKPPAKAFNPEDRELTAAAHEPFDQMLAALGNGRMVDGRQLFEELQTNKASDFLAAPDAAVDELGEKWLEWLRAKLGIAQVPPTALWDAPHLEYIATGTALLPGNVSAFLKTPEHDGQTMGWHAWEENAGSPDLGSDLDASELVEHHRTFMPTGLSFPGMPRARWWEMEDSTIDLSNVRAAKTDTGTLLLAEFSLLFSNDWLLVPLSLPVGHLAKVRSMRVTDVFGVQSVIQSVNTIAPTTDWQLFQMSGNGSSVLKDWIYLPPTTVNWLQSAPLEEIHFIRDEMANMVWAMEKTVPDGLGEGTDGKTAALRLEDWLREIAGTPTTPPPELPENEARLKYLIGSTVPPHWIPFIPIRPDAAQPKMVLRRSAMPRLTEGQAPTRIRPRTLTLRPPATGGSSLYDIEEEEIPVTGLTVRQVWRRARWFDGRTVTWLAREKMLGRHSQGSGLAFDQILDK